MLDRRVLLMLCVAPAARADDYFESVRGDISNDRLAPTVLRMTPGDNLVSGLFGPSDEPGIPDRDYLSIIVPEGHSLASIVLVGADIGGSVSFIGVQSGPVITVPYTTTDPSPLLGWTHFSDGALGNNILPDIGAGFGAIGFTGELPAGVYTFWIMELDLSRAHGYDFNFIVSRECPCVADFDGSGGTPDTADIDGFVTAWAAQDASADADCSGGPPDDGDAERFFREWLAGGC